jgi:GNAT superfamily N-acetyltransferase
MTPAYTFRQATNADVQFMRETKFAGIRPYVEAVWGWNQQQQDELFATGCDVQRSRIVVVDGHDVGFIFVIEDADTAFLAGIYLTPEMRRRGIGSALVRDVIETTVRRGKALTLRVLKLNPARRLYERLGFFITGETESHFLMRCTVPAQAGRHNER